MSARSIPIYPANLVTSEESWIFGHPKRPFWTPVAPKRDMMWYEVLRPSFFLAHCKSFTVDEIIINQMNYYISFLFLYLANQMNYKTLFLFLTQISGDTEILRLKSADLSHLKYSTYMIVQQEKVLSVKH